MGLDIFSEATQKKILDELKVQNALVKIIASGWNIDSYNAMLELVSGGAGPRYFPVGTQIVVPHTAYGGGAIIWDVVNHDGYTRSWIPNDHSMELLMHSVIYGRMVDASEALYAVNSEVWPNGLPAGTYHFTLDPAYDASNIGGKTLQFTTAQVVPVGGVVLFTWGTGVSACKISTYSTRSSTSAMEGNLQCSEGSGGSFLGTTDGKSPHMNHGHRIRYGSNHYGESGVHQWLNSDKAANEWWEPQTEFDRPPNYANVAGFMNGIDPDFLSVVDEVEITTAYNTVFNVDGNKSGVYTTRGKFFLASMTEYGFGKNNGNDEGKVFAFYDGAENVDRIKYDITNEETARHYFMRSPNPSYANNVRLVSTSGALNNGSANSGIGAAAACVIRKSE